MSQVDNAIKTITTLDGESLKTYLTNINLLLLNNIKVHVDDLYYNCGKPTGINDWKYDILKEILINRDPTIDDSIVGAQVSSKHNRINLPFWLGSMDKISPTKSSKIDTWKKIIKIILT